MEDPKEEVWGIWEIQQLRQGILGSLDMARENSDTYK